MTKLSDIVPSIAPAQLSLPDISFASTGQDLSSVASTAGSLLTNLVNQAGGIDAGPDALSLVLPDVTPPPAPPGAPFDAIYAFGDSLSDTGNVSALTGGLVPYAPYDDGRFTNGPVWVEDLAAQLGLAPPGPSLEGGTDFAYGGAQTGATAVHADTPIDLDGQLTQYEAQVGSADPNALYTVWIGGNDIFSAVSEAATNPQAAETAIGQAAGNEGQFLVNLIALGAQHILVLNAPDLGVTPDAQNAGQATASVANVLSYQYDVDLSQEVAALQANGTATIDLVNTFALLDSAFLDPPAYGFSNVRDPIWSGGFTPFSGGTLAATGTQQNQYLFWDSIHPTAQGHAFVADAALASLGLA